MKLIKYLIFKRSDDAEPIAKLANDHVKGKWADLVSNSFDERVALPWDEVQLKDLSYLVVGRRMLSRDESFRAGFPVGFHKGKFALAAQKLEEGEAILEMLPLAVRNVNFSAAKSLIYGFAAQLYATEESFEWSCKRTSPEAFVWWKKEKKKLHAEKFIDGLIMNYNREKHGEQNGFLSSRLKLFKANFPGPLVISGEGCYRVIDEGTKRIRRVFVQADMDGALELSFDFEKVSLLGVEYQSSDVFPLLQQTHARFFQTLVEARTLYD